MARKLYYKIVDDGNNTISDTEWEEISRLQHWYNSEFIWTAGRLALKMYAVFPNVEMTNEDELSQWQKITNRRRGLEKEGLSENEIIRILSTEGLIIVQKGGYFDACIASGFTRVAGNEFNAYLTCEFLLKVSLLIRNVTIDVYDEGEFIKPHQLKFRRGEVIIHTKEESRRWYLEGMIKNHHVFSIVDSCKYDKFPRFQSTIVDFNDMTINEKLSILKDWNWLGFENNFDINGDDIQGYDLNQKVTSFRFEDTSLS